MLTTLFFGAWLIHEMQWRDSVFALVRNVLGIVVLGIAGALFIAEILTERRVALHRRRRRAWERGLRAHCVRVNRFVAELKRNAAEACIWEHPVHGTDILNWLAKHELITLGEADALLAGIRRRAEIEDGLTPQAPRATPDRRVARDDEIPF